MPKKTQRTKGNLKPSSSSQAVQLLAQSGRSPVGFIGFSSQPAYVPASEIFDDADSVLDDDFRLVLRKFSKKDTVTKIKALQEFNSLCTSKNDDCIKAVVPFWPRIYNKVAIDVDHKVRELSQKALLALANKVGKSLSPHLRSIMGSWMVSMYDTYPTVASAANSSFAAVFPPVKQTAALRFCKTECAEFFITNITQQTPQTLSDPLTTSDEDMTGKYQRVVSSSLHAMRKLVTTLLKDSSDDLDALETHLKTLLGSPAFWKHAKSSTSIINGGVLSVLSCVCRHCPSVSGAFISKISPLVFSFIDSKDPSLVSHIWEALLSLINAHQDCWDHVNWQKAVWPKLKAALEGGCGGYAEVIAPCLLPLLSKLPQKNFNQLFESFRVGLTQETVVNSHSTMSALVKAFVECVHYCVVNGAESGDVHGLIQDQVLVVVEASLTDSKVALSRSPLYHLLTPLLTFLENQHSNVEREFWKELSIFTRHNLLSYMGESGGESPSPSEPRNVQSIHSFFNRLSSLVRGLVFQESDLASTKKEKVRFSTTQEYISDKEIFQNKMDRKPVSQNMEHFISDILVTSFYLAAEFEALEYFRLFKNISLLHFPTEAARRLNDRMDSIKLEVFEEFKLARKDKKLGESEADKKLQDLYLKDGTNEFMNFLYSSLLKFIMGEEQQDSTRLNLEFTEDIIISSFSLLQYVNEEDAVQFLITAAKALSPTSSLAVMCQFIEHIVWHVPSIPACGKVMAMPAICTKVSEIAAGMASLGGITQDGDQLSSSVWRMLASFLKHLGQGPLVSNSSLDAVVDSCVTSLDACQKEAGLSKDYLAGLLSVTQILFENKLIQGHIQSSDLMSNLLTFALGFGRLSDNLETVLRAGFNLIASDVSSHKEPLLEICATIRNWVCSRLKTNEDLDLVSKTVTVLVSVVTPGADCRNDDDMTTAGDDGGDALTSSCENILDNLLNVNSFYVDELTEIINELYVDGKVFYPSQKSSDDSCQAVMTLKLFSLLSLYNFRTIKTIRSQPRSQLDDERTMAQALTDTEMNCLVQIMAFLFILKSGGADHQLIQKEVSGVGEELHREVSDCLSCMTGKQIQSLVEVAAKSAASSSLLVSSGLEKCLCDLLVSGKEIHSKRSVKVGVQQLQTQFIHRCITAKEEADVILSSLLEKAVWTGSDITQAYTSVCSAMRESQDNCLQKVSECISSFVHLLSNCKDVTYENRLSFLDSTLDTVKCLKEKDIHLLTGSDSKDSTNTDLLHYNTCVARALALARVYRHDEFWEFSLCTLVEWIQFVSEVNVTSSSSLELQALMASAYQLAHFAAHTFATAPVIQDDADASTEPRSDATVKQKTKTEWEEFFAEGVFQPSLSSFVAVATESLKSSTPRSWVSVIDHLASAVSLCPANFVLGHDLPARLTFTDYSGIPDNLKTLLNHLCPLLNSSQWRVQVAVFNLLCSVAEEIANHEAKAADGNKNDSQEDEDISTPEALSVTVEANAVCLDSFLMTEDIEEDVGLEVGTQEHSLALGYLLAWRMQLKLFKCASNELRAQYAQFFKTYHYVSHLCDHLFRLMPSHPSMSMLEFKLALDGTDAMTPCVLGSLAISVYCQCLEVLPALVRTWWLDQNSKASKFVNRFTTEYISSTLCVRQLTSPDMTSASIEDMTIRPRPAAKEVLAIYEMAEVTVSMTIKLPDNYPLGKMDVSCDKRVGVNQAQWDRWMLQLNIFLQHQNGSIVEGLKLWKRNIDKKFEGIDDCMICFSVIHGTTFQLPRLTCRTCRKKFHSSCLYKWFYTSQKSSCPLCRNLF